MDWEHYFCLNRLCNQRAWMVQSDSTIRDLWYVAESADHHPFTIAATVPVCPFCGTALASVTEIKAQLRDMDRAA